MKRAGLALALWAAAAHAANTPQYRIETVAGSDLLGDGGAATSAQISNIQGIAADRLGNIYLSDTDHHRVRKVDRYGIITTIAGTGSPGFSGDGGPAASAQLQFPYGLAVDLAGYVYIADLGNQRVRRVSPDGAIATYAGNEAPLLAPRNVAVDGAGNLYVSEFTGHRIRKVSPDGRVSTVAGTGVAGFRGDGTLAVNAQLDFPAGIALDRAGTLYIADSQNQRVRRILPTGVIVTVLHDAAISPVTLAIDSSGTIFVTATDAMVRRCPATGGIEAAATLTAPHDLALDLAGNLLIADGVRVRRLDARGQTQTVAGDGYQHAVGDGAAATGGILYQPSAVALDSGGNLYIADPGTQRVRRVAAGKIATFAGSGNGGYDRDLVAADSASLYEPMGVATGTAGELLIADTYNHRVRRVSGGLIATFAGTGESGTGSEGLPPLQTQLRGPRGLCTDAAGTVYIVDTANHRVLRARLNGVVETAAGNGAPGDAGDGGPARLAQLNQPTACAVDSAGNLYVADTFSHRIRKVNPAGVIRTVAGTGQAASALDEVPATVSPLNEPSGVAVDGNGNLFIADTANNRIRLVTPDGMIHTVAGQGLPGFSGDGGPATAARIDTPLGLTVDGAGDVYFADSQNNRVRRLLPFEPPPPPEIKPPPLVLVNAASLAQGAVAPGESVTLYGVGLGPESGTAGTLDAAGLLSNLVAGVEVRFDGVPAPLFYVQAGQINAQVPYTVAGANSTHIEVRYQARSVGTLDLPVAASAPAFFPVVLNQDGQINSALTPAARGTVVTLYATGEGLTTGANIAGRPAAAPFPAPALPVVLSIGGTSAQLLYAGSAPGFVGLMQLNAVIPGGFVPPGQVPVTLAVGGTTSPILTIWLQ